MFTKKALENRHGRDVEVIEELNDSLDDRDTYIEEQDDKLWKLRKKRGLLNIQNAYTEKEIIGMIEKIHWKHIRIKFLALIERILDDLHKRF